LEKEKKETLSILFILISFILVLSFMFITFNADKSNSTIKKYYEINTTKKGLHPQVVSYENFKYGHLEQIKDNNLSKKYIPTCEKELANKFLTNKESLDCMNSYLKNVEMANTYGQVESLRKKLLSCLKDDNLEYALKVNFRGIDIILMDSLLYPTYCQENKEIFYGASGMILSLLGFMLTFLVYLFTHSGLVLFVGTSLSFLSMLGSIIYRLFF